MCTNLARCKQRVPWTEELFFFFFFFSFFLFSLPSICLPSFCNLSTPLLLSCHRKYKVWFFLQSSRNPANGLHAVSPPGTLRTGLTRMRRHCSEAAASHSMMYVESTVYVLFCATSLRSKPLLVMCPNDVCRKVYHLSRNNPCRCRSFLVVKCLLLLFFFFFLFF